MKFSLAGSYRSLKKFIFDMEARSKMYFFSSLELSASADRSRAPLRLEVYLVNRIIRRCCCFCCGRAGPG